MAVSIVALPKSVSGKGACYQKQGREERAAAGRSGSNCSFILTYLMNDPAVALYLLPDIKISSIFTG